MHASPSPARAAVVPEAEQARALLERLLAALETVIHGKREPLQLLLCCVAAGGHVLLEDIPGTGKTTLAKALAAAAGIGFKRVQFTPDLLPTDIVGAPVFQPQQGTFHFKPGPIFTHVLIADEINRASPRTQSALLEALSESQVTVDGETHPLRSPFLCIATQNPVEFHGTYPLPEAQLDRFALQLSLGYPPEAEERRILAAQQRGHPLQALTPVTSAEELLGLQRAVEEVQMEDTVADYLFRLVHATRSHASLRLGVSMRGALLLARLARARALLSGRAFVLPEDIKALAVPALAHRVVLDTRARYSGLDKRALLGELLVQVPVPR
jgi:MoxR-like ATPase